MKGFVRFISISSVIREKLPMLVFHRVKFLSPNRSSIIIYLIDTNEVSGNNTNENTLVVAIFSFFISSSISHDRRVYRTSCHS